MNITHLRFSRNTPGLVRKGEIRGLLSLGVIGLKPVFHGDLHPDRSVTYAIVLAHGADRAAIEAHLRESTNLIPMDAAALEALAVAPFPDRPKTPTKSAND
jgi:hypothetical protein